MLDIKFTNIVIFIIFFGIALIEALQDQNWLKSLLFITLGIMCLKADFYRK